MSRNQLLEEDSGSTNFLPGCDETNHAVSTVAIKFSDAFKHFGGKGAKRVPVLKGLDMSIPRGTIYGLLGPSGCGKTTLLNCMIGKKELNSGTVSVFGGIPGSDQCTGIPGTRVGYMPQHLALYGEFTIRETLEYFGRLYHMPKDIVKQRIKFLQNLLGLPKEHRLIMNLSGGQQRRTSLAVALIHEPELLILDEPTVGVDPLLRKSIWDHLLKISKSSQLQTTIVITTHYIEEARQANVVGMMRFGKLLAEGAPDHLIQRFEKPTLADVFLHLCIGDEKQQSGGAKITGSTPVAQNGHALGSSTWAESIEENTPYCSDEHYIVKVTRHKLPKVQFPCYQDDKYSKKGPSCLSFSRLSALLIKNFIRLWRNIGFLFFQLLIPGIQIALFCTAIGKHPRGMTIAVVNDEVSDCQTPNFGCVVGNKNNLLGHLGQGNANFANFSCRFMSYIDQEIVKPVVLQDIEDAIDSVKTRTHWGTLYFKQNFTSSLYGRMFAAVGDGKLPDSVTLDQSEAHLSLDMSDKQVSYTIQHHLTQAFQKFSQGLLTSCDLPAQLATLPLTYQEPIYGNMELTFTEFMAPGIIVSVTYFMAVGLTALAFITEQKEGLLDRSWVAGVTVIEVTLAHVLSQILIMIAQVLVVVICMVYVFQIPVVGQLTWIILLTTLQGICGMSFGLTISALVDNEQDAIQLALGSFYPNFLLSGVIWPLEGMPHYLRQFSYFLPQTYASEAMRGIWSRGWDIEWMPVYRGYIVTLGWTLAMLILSTIILKVRR